MNEEGSVRDGGRCLAPICPWPLGSSAITECAETGDPRDFESCLGSCFERIGLFIEGRFQRFTGNIKGSTRTPRASFVKLNDISGLI